MTYGCKAPKIDVRDYKLAKSAVRAEDIPAEFIPKELPRVKNQSNVSSCVAHAMSSILEYHDIAQGNTLSTNFIYGIQKQLCGREGSGMYLRDACKIVQTYGDMLKEHCPGNTEVPKCWEIAEKSLNNEEYKKIASAFKVKSYFSLKSIDEIKRAILEFGPVICSIKWYDNFTVVNGTLSGEQSGEYGHHAVMVYGWTEEGFLCQNSWGQSWGDAGRFTLPYSIKIRESFGVEDEDNLLIIHPKRNKFLDFIYKILNFILNLFKKK